jgi:PPOX class probable FMN-dependent enzyme
MWRSHLARTLHEHRNQPESRFFHLATVDLDGRPRNRTVVFRGFLENSDRFKDCLKIVTDSRSQKATQIANNPWAEISWYFPKTRSQFRIFGKLIFIDRESDDLELQAARKSAWQALSEPAWLQFAWAHPREPRIDFPEVTPPDSNTPLPNFCLLLLEPVEVDRLELRGTPQNRWLYLRNTERDTEGNWQEQEVNP